MRPRLQVGSFRVDHMLGRGANAEVWAARHASGTEVALKFARRTAASSEALAREAERIAACDHPGIVHIFDRGTVEGRPFIALERAQGTLAQLPAALAVRELADHLLSALAHLHARDLLHFDIKPSNILVGCAPRTAWTEADRAGVRLADFGISWTGTDGSNSAGTPGWCCPEQTQGLPTAYGPHADIFSLAKVLEEIMDGPRDGAWAPWLARALHPDPMQRFPTAAHARASLPDGARVVRTSPAASPTLETETRPVTEPVSLNESQTPPCAIVVPKWPDQPPASPDRLAKRTFLDAGASLLPYRPTPLAGRTSVLSTLWRQAATSRHLRLGGQDEDVAEVIEVLTGWANEVGLPLRMERSTADGIEVAALNATQLAARARTLGFSPIQAMRVVRGCDTWRAVHRRLLEFSRAHLIGGGSEGLVVRGLPIEIPAAGRPFDERVLEVIWTADNATLAEALAELEQSSDSLRRRHLRLLCRTRIQMPTDRASAEALLEASESAWAAGDAPIAEALACCGAAALGRAWALQETVDRMEGWPQFVVPITQARRDVIRAYLLTFLRHPEAESAIRACLADHDGRFASTAYAALAEWHEAQGQPEASYAAAQASVAAATDGNSVFETLSAYLALIRAQLLNDAPDEEVEAVFKTIESVEFSSFFLQARVLLFRTGFEQRRGRLEEAEWLFTEMQGLYTRHGQPDTVTVIDRTLLCLKRGELSSIPFLVPSDWEDQRAKAPPFLAAVMRVHDLFVALGRGGDEGIERALAALERDPQTVPATLDEAFGLAASLGPRHFADRIRGLSSTGT
ncbi:MAG: serine/threonine-protein kinase [Myxococcota bacterium]